VHACKETFRLKNFKMLIRVHIADAVGLGDSELVVINKSLQLTGQVKYSHARADTLTKSLLSLAMRNPEKTLNHFNKE